ncbi:MAG TPA: 50S ribosomal protein L18 [Anaerolineales bacterium]|nr:50S ribosomal protein L18 [Anaerolineales bacterium]HRF48073.1 50S ribosomal protein L18 [Anaerolineales bacterium]
MAKVNRVESRARRHKRVRAKVAGTAARPRLNIFRSLSHIYAQVIDDSQGVTLVSASTLDAELKTEMSGKKKSEQSKLVGIAVAKRALAAGIKAVIFDRGGYKYHGRVKAVADGAREGGLEF